MSLTKFLNKSVEQSQNLNRVCILKPNEPELQIIHLNSGRNEIGRSRETGIRDVRCSKRQLVLNVDLEKCEIQLKVLGLNPSSLNGFMTRELTTTTARHGDVLEVVYGRHSFEIIFKPPPSPEEKDAASRSSTSGAPYKHEWQVLENGKLLIYTNTKVKASNKIAAYDLDGTIITTKSGNVFPKFVEDWRFLYPEIPAKLKKMLEDGYKVCFFTNQAGLNRKLQPEDFMQKIRHIEKRLNLPLQVFVAVHKNIYRKPAPGMWNYLIEKGNNGVPITMNESFFVGDAAGRDADGKQKRRDHSCADRLFALNVGLKFFTPEEHFLNKKPMKWTMPEFNPTDLPTNVAHIDPESTKIPSSASCEMIVLVGLPGSGKSVFAKHTLEPQGYTIFNADTLGSTQTCAVHCEKVLKDGQSCVIDNTNVDVQARKKFVNIAKRLNVPCRCFVMNLTLGHVKHNIAFRHLTDADHSEINQMVLNTLKKRYKDPSLDEGFSEIVKVNLKYKFKSTDEEKLYKLYLVDK